MNYKKKNINVKIVTGWNDERDKIIANSKILLNVHCYTNYNIYESLRCDRWLFSGNIVVTENSYDDNNNDMKNFLIIYLKK